MSSHLRELSIPELLGLASHSKFVTESQRDDDDLSIGMSVSSLASGISLVPFHFTQPPKIPHVDSHIHRPELKFEYLKAAVKTNPRTIGKRLKKIIKRTFDEIPDVNGYGYSLRDVRNLFDYMENCKVGRRDGLISLEEFDMAIRKFKHAKLHSVEIEESRALVLKIAHLLDLAQLDPVAWFHSLLTGEDGRVTTDRLSWPLFEEALNEKAQENFVDEFDQRDLVLLQRFIDPLAAFDEQNQLTEMEFLFAFKRLEEPPEMNDIMKSNGAILKNIDLFMKKTQMRVRDVFNVMNRGMDMDLKGFCHSVILSFSLFFTLPFLPHSKGLERGILIVMETLAINDDEFSVQEKLKSTRRKKRPMGLPLTNQKAKESVTSSGYGYGHIFKKTSLAKLVPLQSSPFHEPTYPAYPDRKKVFALAAKRTTFLYKDKLTAIDGSLNFLASKFDHDLKVRPGNKDCLSGGAYVSICS